MNDNNPISFFATVPLFMEDLLEAELRTFGAVTTKITVSGVHFGGTLEAAYRTCLWSRTASRILLPIAMFDVGSEKDIFEQSLALPWKDHLTAENTIAVDCSSKGEIVKNSGYAALKVKDAVCDYFRNKTGKRPNVDTDNPDVRINLRIDGNHAIVSIDLSGESLHRRGYRKQGTLATLKENVAAAVLLRADWKVIAQSRGGFIDPMCGSGTLSIEAALIAGDIAPGLIRKRFGFHGWRGHSPDIWKALVDEAQARKEIGIVKIPQIEGWDKDARAVEASNMNAQACGLSRYIRFECRDFMDAKPDIERKPDFKPGLIAIDPPYGKRLEEGKDVHLLYEKLGNAMSGGFPGYRLAILAGDETLARATGLRAYKTNVLYNGRIKCTLACFQLEESNRFISPSQKHEQLHAGTRAMLTNRLTKNMRHLKRWAKRENVTCYRIYDRDMPEYAVAVDFYEGKWVHVQEYAPPSEIDPQKAKDRLDDAVSIIGEILEIEKESIFVKTKRRQKDLDQYEKLDFQGSFQTIHEAGLGFLVNFTDYLDTGIFLDHRITRSLLRDRAKGKRFCNLFGYTGSASVYAAVGDAISTVTVDTSSSYLEWAHRNFKLNKLDSSKNKLVKADCFEFLEGETVKYGLIFCDVPTFSNTKKKDRVFSVEDDHVRLIRLAASRLEADGELFFSTNFRKFKLDAAALGDFDIKDFTARTFPQDFNRDKKAHQCFVITKKV